MAKRNRTPAPGSGRARSAPVQVKKPFPWGAVLASVVLGALLIGIIGYAVANQGEGRVDVLGELDDSFPNLVSEEEPARDHVDGQVDYEGYPERPPVGGEHNGVPQQCAVYDEEIPPEHAVHSLEHGAVWVTYSPDLPADQVEALRDEVEGDPHRLMSALPGQESPIVLTAWGRQVAVDSADDDAVERFLDGYTNGNQTPEKGAACVGVSSTGRSPAGASGSPASSEPQTETTPSAEATPSPQATPTS